MDTLFLFTKHLDDTGCFCLTLDENGLLITPPAQRNFAEIQNLQKGYNTLVIETSAHASLLTAELPWLPERKARVALPFALEERLAQPVTELHFAFDKAWHHDNQYLIAVISKQRLAYVMEMLTANNIEFNTITLDWFALKPDELCVSESTLLINTNLFKGTLSGELASLYLTKHPDNPPLLFTDSEIEHNSDLPKNETCSSHTWIAQKLLKSKGINLCQGEIHCGKKSDWVKKSYQIAGAVFCLWLLSIILINFINLHYLNKHTKQIDTQIAEIYHQFFPDAKQVISPQFRISQLLKNSNNEEQIRFWFLLNQLSEILNGKQFTVEQLHYQKQTLSVTLISADFASLEQLENQLKKAELKVKQTQASTREQQVVATLEIK